MRDGVKIAVDLCLPEDIKQGERLPAILRQTRYWRSIGLRPVASAFIDQFQAQGRIGALKKLLIMHGYAWVDVDVRGSGASYGNRPFEWTPDEIRDGAEIVDWIIRQPWSNRRVGATGISYDGTAAELLQVNRHRAVKAVAPLFALFDAYTDIAFPGGVHLSWFTENWGRLNATLDRNMLPPEAEKYKLFVTGVKPVDEDLDGSLLAGAIRDHAANWDVHQAASRIVFRDDAPLSNLRVSIDTFSPHTYLKDLRSSGAAVYSFSGWLDGAYQHAAIKRFLSLSNPANKLIIGPWNHGGGENISPSSAGNSRFDWGGELLKFFDYYLKDIDTGIRREKRVHYFTMGEERWKATDTWPPAARVTSYYFAAGKFLSADRPLEMKASDLYHVNNLAGTGEQTRWNTLLGASIVHAYPNRAEQDLKLLYYTSAPLEQDAEVTGHPLVTLYVSSTASDGAFFVYLEDVDEQGRVTYVTEGMLRALHRKISTGPAPYVDVVPYHTFKSADAMKLAPGKVSELLFDLLPTSYLFRKGHRLRVGVAGADKDHFAFIPGGEPSVQVYRDSRHASRIDLPVVKR
jgi:putative CocE/NonD family hydrolase